MILDFDIDKYDDIPIPKNYNRYYVYRENEHDETFDDESETVEHVFGILKCLLEKYDMFVYYRGFDADISDFLTLSDLREYSRFDGKSKLRGFWTIQYPALFAKINNEEVLQKILHNWTNVVYISEYIFVAEKDKKQNIESLILQYKYDADKLLAEILPYCLCTITTIPDFYTWDSFNVIFEKQLADYFPANSDNKK